MSLYEYECYKCFERSLLTLAKNGIQNKKLHASFVKHLCFVVYSIFIQEISHRKNLAGLNFIYVSNEMIEFLCFVTYPLPKYHIKKRFICIHALKITFRIDSSISFVKKDLVHIISVFIHHIKQLYLTQSCV